MKKTIAIMLSLALCAACLAACGKAETPESPKEEAKVEEEKETKVEEVEKEETVEEKGSSEAKEEEKTDKEDKRSEAQKFVAQINVGWNLGNTLDAHGAGNTVDSETYWGNPKTTKEMIDAIKAKGFNTIRVPVTFAEHLGPAPDYAIDPAWLDRVEEVVNYGLDNDMFVIMDTHHETDYWLIPEPENEEKITEELVAIWTQLSERFKDYDDHLIFEGMNEPRVIGSAQEWNGGLPYEREVVDHMNQAFVDTVRASGGNNESRYVIICTYGNSATDTTIMNLVIPEDDHLIVSVHMYTPYVFTYKQSAGDVSVWDGSKLGDITSLVRQLKTYLYNRGIPVIITEFGAENKNNEDDIVAWIKDYMGAMNEYGFKCIWWDNGYYDSGNEHFGIFNRNTCTWYSDKIADALIANSISE